jgi:hypothetical protein
MSFEIGAIVGEEVAGQQLLPLRLTMHQNICTLATFEDGWWIGRPVDLDGIQRMTEALPKGMDRAVKRHLTDRLNHHGYLVYCLVSPENVVTSGIVIEPDSDVDKVTGWGFAAPNLDLFVLQPHLSGRWLWWLLDVLDVWPDPRLMGVLHVPVPLHSGAVDRARSSSAMDAYRVAMAEQSSVSWLDRRPSVDVIRSMGMVVRGLLKEQIPTARWTVNVFPGHLGFVRTIGTEPIGHRASLEFVDQHLTWELTSHRTSVIATSDDPVQLLLDHHILVEEPDWRTWLERAICPGVTLFDNTLYDLLDAPGPERMPVEQLARLVREQ